MQGSVRTQNIQIRTTKGSLPESVEAREAREAGESWRELERAGKLKEKEMGEKRLTMGGG